MTSGQSITKQASGVFRHWSPVTRHAHSAALLLALVCRLPATAAEATNPPPVTARDFYNAGTKLLGEKKFAEAERMFESSLAAQDERVQPVAMFNLGHVRFADGAEILKKGPDAQKVTARAKSAVAGSQNALAYGESALADDQINRMLDAYLAGRGARRELRAAEKAVKAAMETCGKTLTRWQRAADDFQGAAELNPADTNAVRNKEIVQEHIAQLVDALRQMQELAGQMSGQKQQLDQMLGKLKGKIPAPNAPPGGEGDDDEDGSGSGQGDLKPESLTGMEEGAGRGGEEMKAPLSPDQAGRMLDALPVDGRRRLPIGGDQEGSPSNKQGKNW